MRHRLPRPVTPWAFLALYVGLAAPTHSAPAAPTRAPAAPTAATTGGSVHYSHHFHHYGRFWHYGHFHHYAQPKAAPPTGSGTGDVAPSFERDGRRYYWRTQNGHRFYSSHPEPGDSAAPDLTGGNDLDAPLSREERAQRAARMQHAQAHLAAVEKRVARQRHEMHLRERAPGPKPRHTIPGH